MKKFFVILVLSICSIQAFCQWTNITPASTSQWFHSTSFIDKDFGFVVGRYWNGSPTGLILKTTDGGTNWSINYTDTMPELRSVFFLNSNLGFVGGDNGKVYRTIDGGSNWHLLNILTNDNISKIYFLDTNVGFVAANKKIFKTNDGGNNWALNYSSISAHLSITFLDSLTGFTCGCVPNFSIGPPYYPTIHKTINGGITWTQSTLTGQDCLFDISFPTFARGYTMGSGGLFAMTNDTGATWIQNNIATTYSTNSISFIDSLTGYAVGQDYANASNGFIIKTTDGGITWNSELTFIVPSLEDIYFPTDTIGYVVGLSGTTSILKKTISTFIQDVHASNSCFNLISAYYSSTSDKININFTSTTSRKILLTIINSFGQLVLTSNFDSFDNHEEIDVSSLAKGFYLVSMNSECNITTRKIILLD